MAVSTSQTFNLDIDEIIAEAYEHLGGPPFVGNDGITARRSLNLLLSDWQNRGILLWTTGFTNQALVSGTEQYELPDNIMAVTEGVSRRGTNDISMTRISAEEYLQIPDKTTTGRSLQFATIKGNIPCISITMHIPNERMLSNHANFKWEMYLKWTSLGCEKLNIYFILTRR